MLRACRIESYMIGGRDNGCSSKRQGVSGRSDQGQS
nr:MAG TPA: hypothetical protein [Caudoviricetes sp.]